MNNYVIIFILIGISSLILYLIKKKRRKASFLLNLRNDWGRERKTVFKVDIEKTALYHKLKIRNNGEIHLDDKTWEDLNLGDVFAYLDRTHSKIGHQYLYHLLKCPKFSEEPLLKFDRLVKRFGEENIREKLQIELSRLNDKDFLLLPNLFMLELPPVAFRFIFLSLSLIAIGSLAMSFYNPAFLFLLIPVGGLNLVINLIYRRRILSFTQPLRSIGALIGTAQKVSKLADEFLAEEQEKNLKNSLQQTSQLVRFSSWFILDQEQQLDILKVIYEYLNMFFLADVNSFVFGIEELRKNQLHIKVIYETLGLLDSAISIASVRAGSDFYSLPQFSSSRKSFSIKALYHPLIDHPVLNSISVKNKGILITGSNMSGKTTFIRSLGVNAVMAQTLYTCFAKEYQVPFVEVKTSIGRSDDLLQGKSYYLAEVESVLALIKANSSSHQHLLLVDELFRGTNAIERIGAAKAILEFLNDGLNFVFVSTHDMELLEMLGDKYDFYHFQEIIEDGQMNFDYKLQSGTSSTRNAIAILELSGYPKTVVKEALRIVDQLEEQKSKHTGISTK